MPRQDRFARLAPFASPSRRARLAAAAVAILAIAAVAVAAPFTSSAQPNAAAAEMEADVVPATQAADPAAAPVEEAQGDKPGSVATTESLAKTDELIRAVSLTAIELPAKGAIPLIDNAYGPAVVELIDRAEADVTMMLYNTRFYVEYPESQTNYILNALCAALERGASVNLLLDVSEWRQDEENLDNMAFARVLAAKGARVRLTPWNEISHQKVLVVDAKASIVSSHNWSFYSTDKNAETAVLIWSDQVANALIDVFEALDTVGADFSEKSDRPAEIDPAARGAAQPPTPGESLDSWLAGRPWLPVEWVTVAPSREFHPRVAEAIRAAKVSVDLAQNTVEYLAEPPPYAGADRPKDAPLLVNSLVDDLVAAAGRGVKVRAVLDWSDERGNDKNIKSAGILRRGGAQVFYDEGGRGLHAKMLVVDGEISVIGSTNWTFNAVEQGNEISVLVKSKPVGHAFTGFVDGLVAKGRPAAAADIPPMTESY